MSTLKLTIKKQWFDMILSGEKTEEYREIKKHWERILTNDLQYYEQGWDADFKKFDTVHFFNGAYYSESLPNFKIECKGIEIKTGNPIWGAELNTDYFVIKLGKILTHSPQ